jgi:hypothetical protein
MLHANLEVLPHGARAHALEVAVKLIIEAKRLALLESLLHRWDYNRLVVLACDVRPALKATTLSGKPLIVSIMKASLPKSGQNHFGCSDDSYPIRVAYHNANRSIDANNDADRSGESDAVPRGGYCHIGILAAIEA